jgi:hypothetical protein
MDATMNAEQPPTLETDPRFPSGPWVGFFLQKSLPGKHTMELRLTFQAGNMNGEGRDRVGEFLIKGRYDLAACKCYWTKKYLGRHDVFYQGFNEGKGIWGVWEIGQLARGGFHIWPEAMGHPTNDHLVAEAELPEAEPMELPEREPVEVGASSSGKDAP